VFSFTELFQDIIHSFISNFPPALGLHHQQDQKFTGTWYYNVTVVAKILLADAIMTQ